jgi:hypothetical protein
MTGIILIVLIALSIVVFLVAITIAQFSRSGRIQEICHWIWMPSLLIAVLLFWRAYFIWHAGSNGHNILNRFAVAMLVLVFVWYIAIVQLKHHRTARHQHLPQ